jgi:hypothetical protein
MREMHSGSVVVLVLTVVLCHLLGLSTHLPNFALGNGECKSSHFTENLCI